MAKPTYRPYDSRRYVVMNGGDIQGYRIPKGFKFDGASVPRFAWSIVGGPFHPKAIDGACLHDYLGDLGTPDRKTRDELFLHQLTEDGHTFRNLFYWSVRIFGKLHAKLR